MKNATHARIRRSLDRTERIVPRVAMVAAGIGVVLVWRTQRSALAGVDWTLSWQPAVLSALAFAVAPLAQGLSFWLVLRTLTGTTSLPQALVVWSRSYIVRYAPTGALALAYRVTSRRRLDASPEQVLAAYAYEHVGALAAGAASCLTLYAVAFDFPPVLPLAIAVVVLALTAAARPGLAGRLLEAAARRLGLRVAVVLPTRRLVAVVAINMGGWIGTGTGVYVLVNSLLDSSFGVLWLLSSYAAAYLVGFVAPLAPGGIGAREGTLVMLLGPRLGTASALGASVVIRVLNVAGELLAVGAAHLLYGAYLLRQRVALAPASA